MARVPAAEMGEIEQARTDLARAEDAIAKQDLALASAEKEISVAKDDIRVADAELARTKSMSNQADFDRDAPGQRQSGKDSTRFVAQKAAAEAHLKAANSSYKLVKAQKKEAEAARDFAKAQLASRQYDALVATGDPSVRETNPRAINKDLDESRSRMQAAKGEVSIAKATADRDMREWESSQNHSDSRRGIGASGQ